MTWALALWVFLLPLQTRWIASSGKLAGGPWEYGTFSVYATDALLLLLLAVWFFRRRPSIALPKGILVNAALFVGAIGFSIFQAGDFGVSLTFFLRMLLGFCAFWLFANHKNAVAVCAFALVLSAVVQTALAWVQFDTQTIPASTLFGVAAHEPSVLGDSVVETADGRFLRAYGTLPHPNMLAAWFVVGLVAATGFFLRAGERRWRLASLSAVLIISSGLVLTFSRSGLLAWFFALLALAVIAFLRVRHMPHVFFSAHVLKLFVATFALFLALRVVLSPIIETRVSLSGRLETQSLSERAQQLDDVKRLLPDAWFLGVGAGNYTHAVYEFVDSGREWWQYQPIHNVWLLAFVEIGIFGFSVFLAVLVSLARYWKRAVARSLRASPDELFPWHVVFTLALVALFVMSMVDHFLWSLEFGMFLAWTVVGLSLATGVEEKEHL